MRTTAILALETAIAVIYGVIAFALGVYFGMNTR
jgi:hypothetical protein